MAMGNAVRTPSFEGHKVIGYPLMNFLKWTKDSSDLRKPGSLSLPPVQRSSLWRPRQVLALWDSLLRGLPLGLFYLVERKEGELTRSFDENAPTREDASWGYQLLDGQQRTRAMMLAVQSPKQLGRCLWVDLAGDLQDGMVRLRLTTRSQPFGYDEDGNKLSLSRRRKAREAFDAEAPLTNLQNGEQRSIYDHELFELEIARTKDGHSGWPPKPGVLDIEPHQGFVPLHQLFEVLRTTSDPGAFASGGRALIKCEADRKLISDEKISILRAGFKHLEEGEVALMRVEPEKFAGNDNISLLTLFERIGAGGTPLSEPERLYSIYKHHLPRVRDVVEAIESDQDVGHVMSATEIAGTALRIARVRGEGNHHSAPGSKELASLIGDKAFRTQLNEVMPLNAAESEPAAPDGSLAAAFRDVFSTLRYRSVEGDAGLPNVMLADLSPDLVQVLVYWAMLARKAGTTVRAYYIREEMIRFALFWYLCVTSDLQAGRQAFLWLGNPPTEGEAGSKNVFASFPGRELYQLLTGESPRSWGTHAFRLASPGQLRAFADAALQRGDRWLSDRDRFEHDGEGFVRNIYRTWWWSRGKMLLWLQRAHLQMEFGSYNPSSDRDDDKPFDLDHIQPQALFSHSDKASLKQGVDRRNFDATRHLLRDGIGNLRWIGSGENRRAGASGLTEKLLLEPLRAGSREADLWMRSAFSTSPEDIETWIHGDASKGWTPDRVTAFQKAVEQRTLWLYERFYNQAGFDAWLNPR